MVHDPIPPMTMPTTATRTRPEGDCIDCLLPEWAAKLVVGDDLGLPRPDLHRDDGPRWWASTLAHWTDASGDEFSFASNDHGRRVDCDTCRLGTADD
jgi:hypothetical protein